MDKRIAQLLELVSKTGDRLVILPESGDPFVLMDLAQYQELQDRSQAGPTQPLAPSEPEIIVLDPASPSTAEEKYYFEPVQTEQSQAEATK